MRPQQLTQNNFSSYPPQARKLATDHLDTLRNIPLSLLPTLLCDMQDLDWKFPPEQVEIIARLGFIESSSAPTAGFAAITVPENLAKLPWVNVPQRFVEEFTSYLWSSQQMDTYRRTAAEFVQQFQATLAPKLRDPDRLVMVVIGRDAKPAGAPLFRKLGPHGQILTRVDAMGAMSAITQKIAARAALSPSPYAHWYIDGGSPINATPLVGVTELTYPALTPLNQRILDRMTAAIQAGSGPEALRTELGRLAPIDLSADKVSDDPRLQHFAVSVLTEASGTQIFSTSFVQWTAREVLRRAQPATLLVRFAPRQRQREFNAMVQSVAGTAQLDPEGSLIDADMGAYYTYLEMKKLTGAENAIFLVYVEGRSQAFLSGPEFPKGTRNDSPAKLTEILQIQEGGKS